MKTEVISRPDGSVDAPALQRVLDRIAVETSSAGGSGTWQPITYGDNWGNYASATYGPVEARMVGDTLEVQGVATKGGTSINLFPGDLIGTLPVSPPRSIMWYSFANVNLNDGVAVRLNVDRSGRLTVAFSQSYGSVFWVCLNGLRNAP